MKYALIMLILKTQRPDTICIQSLSLYICIYIYVYIYIYIYSVRVFLFLILVVFNIKYQSSVWVANFGAGFEEMPGNGPRGEAVMSCSSGLIRYGTISGRVAIQIPT